MPQRTIIVLTLSVLMLAHAAGGTIHDGSIAVTVQDADANPIDGAVVTVFISGAARSGVVSAGRFLFPAIPPGEYLVQAEAEGFETVIREGIHVGPAMEVNVPFVLQREPDQTVTLTEEVSLMDPVGTTSGKSFRHSALSDVPRWHTFTDLVPAVQGIVTLSMDERETLTLQSRGTAVGNARWLIESWDVTTSDPRLSAAILSPLRTPGEIRVITGGADPTIASSGMQLIAAAPGRADESAGSFFITGSDGDLGGSSAVPRSLRGALERVDSFERAFEAGGSISLPLLTDKLWGWGSFALRSLEGSVSRRSEQPDAAYDESTEAVFLKLDWQRGVGHAARASAFYASREDRGGSALDAEAAGMQLHASSVVGPQFLIEGSASVVRESDPGDRKEDRWLGRSDLAWIPVSFRAHQLEAGMSVGERGSSESFSFYAGDTLRFRRMTAIVALRGESNEVESGRIQDVAPRVTVTWLPRNGDLLVRGGFSRYIDSEIGGTGEPDQVDELHIGLEREIATGFLLTSAVVERKFDIDDARFRAVEIGARRRMSSGLFLDGQVAYFDDDRPEMLDAHWAYDVSAVVQIPMVGVGAGMRVHGHDGISGTGETVRPSDSWALDVRLWREFGTRWPVTLSVDVFNVTNERALLADERQGQRFLVQTPRAVRVGLSTTF